MEPITPEQKQPFMKSLAVAGLLGIIAFIAWAAIQIVQIFPTAITSLASLADSVYNYNPNITRELEFSNSETMVNANESIDLSWKNLNLPGTYTFTYECVDGLTLNLSTGEKAYSELTCDKSYELGNVESAKVTVYSNQNRFADLKYKVDFFRTNSTTPAASKSGSFTIINETMDLAGETVELPAVELPPVVPETVATTSEEIVPEPVTPTPPVVVEEVVKPVVATTTPAKPKPVVVTPTYTYAIPVSKPDGTTDLVASYLGIGQLYTNGMFNNEGVVRLNQPGTVQFAVHNIGSKTSASWTFEVALPGNINYTSAKQEPLKPNERAVLNLSFPAQSSSDIQNLNVTVVTNSDTNYANNVIKQTVLVLK